MLTGIWVPLLGLVVFFGISALCVWGASVVNQNIK